MIVKLRQFVSGGIVIRFSPPSHSSPLVYVTVVQAGLAISSCRQPANASPRSADSWPADVLSAYLHALDRLSLRSTRLDNAPGRPSLKINTAGDTPTASPSGGDLSRVLSSAALPPRIFARQRPASQFTQIGFASPCSYPQWRSTLAPARLGHGNAFFVA